MASDFLPRRALYLYVSLFLAAAAIISALAYRYHIAEWRLIEGQVSAQLSAIAGMKVKHISGWRQERLGVARAIMADRIAAAALDRFLARPNAEPARSQVLGWLEGLCRHLH